LQQAIEEKLIENILLELDENNTDSNDKQKEEYKEISEFFMLDLLALNEVYYLKPPTAMTTFFSKLSTRQIKKPVKKPNSNANNRIPSHHQLTIETSRHS
ncbi:7928_t:CDS:2, partial [Rhizophagus irregularis]